MDISSIPAAPLLVLTRLYALSIFCRDRICSSRSAYVPPGFPCESSDASTRPHGVFVEGRGPQGEEHPTGSGLPATDSAVLCPLLTPPPATRRLPVAPLPACGSHEMEVSPDKNANCNCTASAFTSEPEPWALACCAALPDPSALYAVSVRRHTVLLSGCLPVVGRPSTLAFG
jgi:hypothetical protein